MIAELRASLELARHRRLHAQIGALRREINILCARHEPGDSTRFYKLLAKQKRLERELAQPMLIDVARPGGAATGT